MISRPWWTIECITSHELGSEDYRTRQISNHAKALHECISAFGSSTVKRYKQRPTCTRYDLTVLYLNDTPHGSGRLAGSTEMPHGYGSLRIECWSPAPRRDSSPKKGSWDSNYLAMERGEVNRCMQVIYGVLQNSCRLH